MNLLHRMKTLHIVYIILRKISLQCNLRYKIYTFTLQRYIILLKNSITESLNVLVINCLYSIVTLLRLLLLRCYGYCCHSATVAIVTVLRLLLSQCYGYHCHRATVTIVTVLRLPLSSCYSFHRHRVTVTIVIMLRLSLSPRYGYQCHLVTGTIVTVLRLPLSPCIIGQYLKSS